MATAASSRATAVTFFEDRAEVTRAASVRVEPGPAVVEVAGVSALVDDGSLTARVTSGPAEVVAARVRRRGGVGGPALAGEIGAAERDLAEVQARRRAAEADHARATAARDRALALAEAWTAALARPRAGGEAVAGWVAGREAIDAHLVAALDLRAAADLALGRARVDEARALARLGVAQAAVPSVEALVEVQVQADDAGEVGLELRYRVPCALWRPEHLARASAGAGGRGELTLTTSAVAWQRTGEAWEDVEARFSTARPGRSPVPPLMREDALVLRRRTDEERRQLVVEARDEDIEVAGLDRGTRAVDGLPGVDDGGRPLELTAPRPVTVPSDGGPVRIEVGEVAMPCALELVAIPERSAAVHLRATATHPGPAPILAGPVRVARSAGLVGRSRTALVAPGEPFELGLGADDGLRVRRVVDERRDRAGLGDGRRVERAIRIHLSNLGGEPRRVLVTERVPVSEIERVRVEVLDAGGGVVDADGICRVAVDLAPGETRALRVAYRLEASGRVVLPAVLDPG